MTFTRTVACIALAAALGGCSVSSLLGGGGKPPISLQTLTAEAPDPGAITRSANTSQAVSVALPIVAKELSTVRVPVQVNPTDVQYVTGVQWVDTPDRLFRDLLAETITRTTNRVVLPRGELAIHTGLVVGGELQRFGYDAATGQVTVVYDGTISAGGGRVETRRFIANVPSDGTGPSVGPALNRAANQVATEVAQWIGNSSAG